MSTDRLGTCGKPVFFALDAGTTWTMAAPAPHTVLLASRSLGGMQKEALVAASGSSRQWRLASDEGAYLAGLDAAPCPLSFFTIGLLAALHAAMREQARQGGATLQGLRLVLDSYYTMRGSALKRTMVGGARDAHLTVQCEGHDDPQALLGLARDAVANAPAVRLLTAQLANRFALSLNGQALPVAGLPAFEPGAAGERHAATPDGLFDAAQPAIGDWSGLIVRGGLTPPAAHSVTQAGGSLSPEQDRLLHVRGVGALRPDGLLEVQQYLYNPHGSMFRYLCDTGGQGRAPDPLSYLAAGIGFCFMTQFGRFAAIAKLPLADCRIVQALRFGEAGEPAPVDTAVQLAGELRAEDAATMLQMAEQTCFLHALCRSQVQVQATARAWSEGLPPPEA